MNIEVRNLSFGYAKDSRVLNEVSLEVGSGATVSILGASGSGKSTLLKLIAGFLGPASHDEDTISGDILFDGNSIYEAKNPLLSLKKQGRIGYLSQVPFLLNHLTAWQNVCVPSQVLKVPNDDKNRALMDLVGLSSHMHKLPKELSGGMRTRVALARMFSTDPDLLLLDEPFSSLDVARRSELYREFDRLQGTTGRTMIIVTHDVFEAIVFSDQLCVMDLTGRAFQYTVTAWRPGRSYEEVVSENFSCFADISEIIRSGA